MQVRVDLLRFNLSNVSLGNIPFSLMLAIAQDIYPYSEDPDNASKY